MRDRTIRLRRRGLSPAKIVFVYCLAFLLVSGHQAGRVADWFEDVALGREGLVSETAFGFSSFFRDRVNHWGPALLNRVEDWALALFSPDSVSRPFRDASAGPAPNTRPGSSSGQNGRTLAKLPPTYWALDSAKLASISPPPDDQNITALRPPASQAGQAKAFNPARVLLLGDSMMLEGLGPPLQRELKKNDGLAVFRDGRYGTGLTRLDNFDWLAYFDQMLEKYHPDLVILTLGANDPQDMVEDGRRLPVGGQDWTEIYAQRVADLLTRAEAHRVRVFWVGLPVMGREPYGARIAHINKVADAVCLVAPNCSYWDSRLAVADAQGGFTAYLPDAQGRSVRVRAKDSIHLTEVGGRLMTEKFLAETANWADYRQIFPAGQGLETDRPGLARPLAPSAGDEDEAELVGQVTRHTFFSRFRNKETPYLTVVPEPPVQGMGAAAQARSRPVVFLLHGAWGGYSDWAGLVGSETLASLAAERGLILVLPDGEPFGWYLDGRETAIESYLLNELIPRVLALYPEADPDRLAVTGLSMGGHGALTLALKHPSIFKAVGSISGVTDLSAHARQAHSVDSSLRIDRVLGPAGPDGQNWLAHSAVGLTEKKPENLAGRPLILSVGLDDGLTLAENRAYHRLLTELGIDHVYLEGPGGHDWKYWSAQLPVHLDFMADQLKARSQD